MKKRRLSYSRSVDVAVRIFPIEKESKCVLAPSWIKDEIRLRPDSFSGDRTL